MNKSELLEFACDHAMEGFALHDAEGRFVYVNPAQSRMYGYEPDELLGQHWDVLYDAAELKMLESKHMPTLVSEGAWSGELVGLRKDGSQFNVAVSLKLIVEADGSSGGLVCNCRDITDEKNQILRLQQLQRLDSLGQLTGGMAHDFNNILTILLGSLDLAAERSTEPGVQQHINTAVDAANQGVAICRRLLAFSSQQSLEPVCIKIDSLFEQVSKILKMGLPENIDLETECSDAELKCFADFTELENAILNLVINGRDAMPEGGVIKLSASAVAPEVPGQPDRVSIKVTDNGAGMPAEVVDRIFDPLFSTKPQGKGTGLGLSIVYGFAKQSNGTVTVRSTIGEGTEFELILPQEA